ncbi:hypothetical protein, partial [Streptococcus thermophilus]|uniref:hypothetical protein n=1 Tax=Streptococcus thermophilus TaxID=1308 RepID=UPI0034674249
VPDELRQRFETGGVSGRLQGALVGDAGGVLASLRRAYDLAERRRAARAATPDRSPDDKDPA